MNPIGEIYEIPLRKIRVSNLNVRTSDKNAEIENLAESIRKHGLLQPVVLMGDVDSPPYELVIGQRRLLASKLLRLKGIKAIFCDEDDPIALLILSLSENMQRVDLNPADKAEAITNLFLHYGKDDKRVARELGLSVPTVRDYIKIEVLASTKAKRLLRVGKVTKTDVKRAIDASRGNQEKADKLLNHLSKLKTKYERDRIVGYGKTHPRATVKKIISEAAKPRMDRAIILNLTVDIERALNKAGRVLSMDKEEIAERALTEWLKKNRFLS